MQEFSQNDLLQYIYNETSPAKSLAIKLELITNSELSEQFYKLEETLKMLDKLVVGRPSSRTIKRLLDISENFPTHEND